ncbi:metal ABC transporter solute-binding protein, Zn/Mn family [Neoasaia chiangmaiensis]|uniref:metal ABC transporter solute-binding protein, Zn/Mn family n=1 Tax=Neoasaia chiangmaiensis TaxID=320497 RepID=UPI00223166EF|nr:zinc ABC transporter substrate-binding protein [Neoasaia chiangmaiensis]
MRRPTLPPWLAGALCIILATMPRVEAAPVRIVCAEAVWCDIATQIGGPAVSTEALVVSTRADPHDIATTPAMARAVAQADILVLNGAEYDPWAGALAEASGGEAPMVLNVGQIGHWREGDNPHLFDDLETTRLFAAHLTAVLTQRRPDAQEALARRADSFTHIVAGLQTREQAMANRLRGRTVAMTEPIGGALLSALGIRVIDDRLALAMMHRNDPAPRDVAMVEAALRTHQVGALIVNPNVTNPSADRLADVARQARVPIISMTEIPPPGRHWQDWIGDRLDALGHVTGAPS